MFPQASFKTDNENATSDFLSDNRASSLQEEDMSSAFSRNPKTLSTPVLIALVTLKGYQDFKKKQPVYIEDLARHLAYLKTRGIDISRIALSRSLDKYWSDDVAQFVSEGLVFGFLTHKSPLKFDKRCLEVCQNAIDSVATKEGIEELNKAREYLELEPMDVLAT
jgi:hypothetical protein